MFSHQYKLSEKSMKEKISISLDKDLINELQKRTANISGYINQTLRENLSKQPSIQQLLMENNQNQGSLIYAMRDAINSIEGMLEKDELTTAEIQTIKQLVMDFNLNLDALEKSRVVEKRALILLSIQTKPKTSESMLPFSDLKLAHFMESLTSKQKGSENK